MSVVPIFYDLVMLEMCSSIMLPLCYVWHLLRFCQKLPYIYLQFHIVPPHSVDLPHPLLCWGLQDWCWCMVRMWRCFWQDGAVNCFRFVDTLLADTASHHWLLGSFYCQDRVLWWYFVWISNTIWSYSQWDPGLPCPRMAQCTLYSGNLGPSIWWTLKKLSSFLY